MSLRKIFYCICFVLLALSLSGCRSLRGLQQRSETRERSEMMLMREQVETVSGRMDDMQTQIDELWKETQSLRQANKEELKSETGRLESRIADLEKQMDALEAARAKDRKEIIEKMSKTVSSMISNMGGTGGTSSGGGSQYGVEHTVEPGQTLSEIASAYDVEISAIIKSNNLKNPDQLKVGQKLFIPE